MSSKRIGVVRFVVHSKTFRTNKKIHLLVFPDEKIHDFFIGKTMESECDLEGIYLKEQMFERAEEMISRLENIETKSFFIPLGQSDFEKNFIPFSKGNMICDKCKENYYSYQKYPGALFEEIEDYIHKREHNEAKTVEK